MTPLMHITGNYVFRPRFDAWRIMAGAVLFCCMRLKGGAQCRGHGWLWETMRITFVEFLFLVTRSGLPWLLVRPRPCCCLEPPEWSRKVCSAWFALQKTQP